MSNIRFTGIMPAMITPIDANGKVIEDCVKRMVEDQLAAGCTGYYVTGGTGEGVMLSKEQRFAMVEAVVKANAGRGKVIVHTGSINAEEGIELTRQATAVGADGISSVLPNIYFSYGYKEIVNYYKRMADNTDLPLILYANHTANGVDANKLIAELLQVENIIGAKDTRANYYQMWKLKQVNGGDINVINGPDEMLLCGLAMGADGGIGSTYNVMPEKFVRLFNAFKAGNIAAAQAEQTAINRIIQGLIENSNGYVIRGVKAALALRGYNVGVACAPSSDFTADELKVFADNMRMTGYEF